MTTKVLVNGAKGRMGRYVVNAIQQADALTLVGAIDLNSDLATQIALTQAQVVVDFTTATAGYQNTQIILHAGARPVIGTSGFLPEHIKHLAALCQEKKLGAVIAPNFSIGAVLMMKYAAECARYFPDAEIIELHHNQKADAPSGTSLKTAELIARARTSAPTSLNENELLPGARGANHQGVPIHSVRLPGFMAHQQVIFGNVGETLTLCHDSIDRSCFMPGVILACSKVITLDRLIYGLEFIL